MRAIRIINMVVALVTFTLSGVAKASLESMDQQGRQTNQVVADRVVMFESGKPVCRASLVEQPQLKPNFVKLGVETPISDAGPLGKLRPCDGQELTDLAQMADLVDSGNRIAALPLVIIPVVVCAAGIALGAWSGHEAGRLMMTDSGPFLYSTWGATGASEALAVTATGVLKLPVTYAAAYGGLIGASCGMVGSVAGFFYYQSKQAR